MNKINTNSSCMMLHELLKRAVSAHPRKPAIIYRNEKITYGRLDELTTRLSNSLINLGVCKGDRVGILLPRIPELVISYLALSKCGAIGFPISYESPPEEIRRILSETEPSVVIVHKTYLKLIEGIFHKIYCVVGGAIPKDTMYSFQYLLQKGKSHPYSISIHPQDTFYLNFTSGTTGAPKGAVTTHAHIFYNTVAAIDALDLISDDIHMCMFAPYSHPHEIFARPLYLGGTLVLLDTIFPQSMAQTIEENHVTCIMALPPFYEMLLEVADRRNFDFSSLRIVESGGMYTHEDLKDRFMGKFGIRITAVWGSTETTGIAIVNKWRKLYNKNSIGTPCKYYDVRVVDDNGRELKSGKIGELTFRGPGVISKYYNNKRSENFSTGGDYFSGDLGIKDDEGHFFFLGRKSGMLKVGGWKVYPLEIEIILNSHPSIKESAVVGVNDRKRGEIPKALIVLDRGTSLNKYDIMNFCKRRLARYKIPRIIEFIEELPKLPSGKLDREAFKKNTIFSSPG